MERPERVLVSYAAAEAFTPSARPILAKLGYGIYTPEQFEEIGERDRPDAYVVDERSLADVPDEGGMPPIPIVVLTGRHGVSGADGRIVGAIRRPAGLHELFRMIQQICELKPRTTPRVPTHLPARCTRDGESWSALILSLSENGCLLRSPEPLLLGTRVQLAFDLPGHGALEVRAETAYQLLPDLGMVFHGTSPADRRSLAGYVEQVLARL